MYYPVNILLNHSIVLTVAALLIRCRRLHPSDRPLAYFVCMGCINETLSLLLILHGHPNSYTSNCYVLAEYGLLLWQFGNWMPGRHGLFGTLAGAGVLCWVTDNLLWHSLGDSNSFFRLWYAFVIACCSVRYLDRLVFNHPHRLAVYPRFLFSLGLLLFYSFKSLFETFNLLDMQLADSFYRNLWITMGSINFTANIIYATAFLCLPKKQDFSIQYYSQH